MNAEYVWWLLILVAVGIGVVTYLALGPVPEMPPATHHESATAADDDQSSPVSTTEPGAGESSSTSETP